VNDTPERLLAIARGAALDAGLILMRYLRHPVRVDVKNGNDLVSEADIAAERALLAYIRERGPHHRIVSEEAGDCGSDSEVAWYVDPLDGTRNFARGLPLFCVSVGVSLRGEMVAAVIHDPAHQETFSAMRGGGARLNSRTITVSPVSRLREAVLATGYPSPRRHAGADPALLMELGMRTQGLRRSGSSALDLAWVAAGRLEAFWDRGLQPWDVAAGSLLVSEAGGLATALDGSPWRPGSHDLVAAAPGVHAELTAILTRG
jgi:myo-inositol-1(or 4)-monophosphatase